MLTSNIIKNLFFLFFINNCCSSLKDKEERRQSETAAKSTTCWTEICEIYNVRYVVLDVFWVKEQVNKKDNRFISSSLNLKKREIFVIARLWSDQVNVIKIQIQNFHPVVFHMFQATNINFLFVTCLNSSYKTNSIF